MSHKKPKGSTCAVPKTAGTVNADDHDTPPTQRIVVAMRAAMAGIDGDWIDQAFGAIEKRLSALATKCRSESDC